MKTAERRKRRVKIMNKRKHEEAFYRALLQKENLYIVKRSLLDRGSFRAAYEHLTNNN